MGKSDITREYAERHNIPFTKPEPISDYEAHEIVYGTPWTDEDEAALDEWEENKRRRIAEENEY